ncbi:hypothetical protein ALO79_200239 [Pseudomonas syringae pv. castaneae]|uniref:Uncharacterized protein n=1 Tax=Pseudomonas syringae pv. castaneae TaxID=264450 RepID=A0A0N8R3L3_PSESX|nr:hypothetical protein ALO79_200239 [Pseudomonas syringae pv. castaneae]
MLGNGPDHVQDLADILRLVGQGLHQPTRHLHVTGEGANRVNRVADPLLSEGCRLTGLTRGVGGGNCVARHFLYGSGHFGDGRGGLFNFVVLLLQALGAVEGDGVQLIGCRCQLRRRTTDALQRIAQVFLHGRQGLEQAAHFVIAMGLDRPGQVTYSHAFRGAQRFTQGFDDAARQQHRQDDGSQGGQDDEQANDHPGTGVMLLGFLALDGHLFGKQLRQVIELLAGTVHDGFHVHQQQFDQFVAAPLLREDEGLRDTRAVGGKRLLELVVERFAFRGHDELFVTGDFFAQFLVTDIHLPTVDRDVLGVLVQGHAQGDGSNAQHPLANLVTAANAR